MHIHAACPFLAGLNEVETLKVIAVVWMYCVFVTVQMGEIGKFQRDTKVLEELIVQRLPRLAAALESEEMPSILFFSCSATTLLVSSELATVRLSRPQADKHELHLLP